LAGDVAENYLLTACLIAKPGDRRILKLSYDKVASVAQLGRGLGGLRRSKAPTNHPELAGSSAVRALPRMSDATHAAALALVDELIAMGSREALEPELLGAPLIDRTAVRA